MKLYKTFVNDVYYSDRYGFLKHIPNSNAIIYIIHNFNIFTFYNDNCDMSIIDRENYEEIFFTEFIDYNEHYYVKNTNTQNTFMYYDARAYNFARIKWIDSLNVDFNGKRVLEIGCGGCGDITRYLYSKGGIVDVCDCRQIVLDLIKSRVPQLNDNNTFLINVENIGELDIFKKYDIIVCLGLLYHISNPCELLIKMRSLCDTLILETMINNNEDNVLFVNEDKNNINQSFSGIGNLCKKQFLYDKLSELFDTVDISKQSDSIEISSNKRFGYLCY